MKNLSEYNDVKLMLVSTSFFGLDYDLIAGKEVIASYGCDRTFSMNGLMNGFGKSIEFYKESAWKGTTSIREAGKENPFAVCKREAGFYTGIVELQKGNRVRIKLGFFYVTVTIEKENGTEIAVLKRANFLSGKINLLIKEKSALLDENPWIIFLALHLSIRGMMRRL